MNVDYPLLIVALLLLWFPRQLLRSRSPKLASRARPSSAVPEQIVRDDSLKPLAEFKKSRNWVDLFRAATGGAALFDFCFDRSGDNGGGWVILALQAGLLVVALLTQMVRVHHGRISLVAPIFYLMGLSFVLIGWQAALFACATTWAFCRVLPGPGPFLLALAFLEAVFAVLYRTAPVTIIAFAVFVTVLPVLLSGMFKRPLVPLKRRQRKAAA